MASSWPAVLQVDFEFSDAMRTLLLQNFFSLIFFQNKFSIFPGHCYYKKTLFWELLIFTISNGPFDKTKNGIIQYDLSVLVIVSVILDVEIIFRGPV